MEIFFERTFMNMQQPVVVCDNKPGFPVIYANISAKITFNPLITIQNTPNRETKLSQLINFEDPRSIDVIQKNVLLLSSINSYTAAVMNMDGELFNIKISGNLVNMNDREYLVLYLLPEIQQECSVSNQTSTLMSTVYHIAYHTADADEALEGILQVIGDHLQVDRVYVFEDAGGDLTENTYEWCAPHLPEDYPKFDFLKKSEYSYDEVLSNGLLITDNIEDLSEKDQIILNKQGVKSMAAISLFTNEQPMGILGFDVCRHNREWSRGEIHALKGISQVISSLIVRRNISRRAARSLDILQTISDNTDNFIYVCDVATHETVFVNKRLAVSLDTTIDALVGSQCWQSIRGEDAPCSFCPISQLLDEDCITPVEGHSWEYYDPRHGKWFLANDSIITWIDGRKVYIETATDITIQKNQEDQLRVIASTDKMTGLYNRQWGFKAIQSALAEAASIEKPDPINLCFIDIDGLKYTNDTFGHNAGDEMIKTITGALKSRIRRSDMMCRWGGDEFLILLRCETDVAQMLIKKALNDLNEINAREKLPYKLSFSYGIVNISSHLDLSVDALVSKADNLMYEQKTRKYQGESSRP